MTERHEFTFNENIQQYIKTTQTRANLQLCTFTHFRSTAVQTFYILLLSVFTVKNSAMAQEQPMWHTQ